MADNPAAPRPRKWDESAERTYHVLAEFSLSHGFKAVARGDGQPREGYRRDRDIGELVVEEKKNAA